MKFKGGNLYWKEIEEELKKAYQYEIISYEEGRDLEVNPKNPLPQPDKEVVVEFNILSKPNISEFKSKYYVGNGKLDTKRTDFVSIMDKKNG
jgi:ABC-type transporter MlaC component